nr:hypothetical protein [Vibrio parahaemolyticus]
MADYTEIGNSLVIGGVGLYLLVNTIKVHYDRKIDYALNKDKYVNEYEKLHGKPCPSTWLDVTFSSTDKFKIALGGIMAFVALAKLAAYI